MRFSGRLLCFVACTWLAYLGGPWVLAPIILLAIGDGIVELSREMEGLDL